MPEKKKNGKKNLSGNKEGVVLLFSEGLISGYLINLHVFMIDFKEVRLSLP